MIDKQKIMRYAQLALATKRSELSDQPALSDAQASDANREMEHIRKELGMTHGEIMECVAKNLIDEN